MKHVYVNKKWCLDCHLCEYYCKTPKTAVPLREITGHFCGTGMPGGAIYAKNSYTQMYIHN
ncbi:MAG: hypothetical protein LBS64_00525 [Spirochaetaceae bacterium]|jgi:hypothetical protein|nr:hypothetical protein [Spirochaetaceae bacterium]